VNAAKNTIATFITRATIFKKSVVGMITIINDDTATNNGIILVIFETSCSL